MSFARFRSATLWALLAFAAINACSYFFRSDIERLWGVRRVDSVEAIGFPLLVWREEGGSVEYFGYSAFVVDFTLGVVLALLIGCIGSLWGGRRSPVADGQTGPPPGTAWPTDGTAGPTDGTAGAERKFQFGVRTMLGLTLLVALDLAAFRAGIAVARWIVIGAYACGPWLILAGPYLIRRSSAAARWLLASSVGLSLVVLVVAAGGALDSPREFDRMFMGLYVCWVPQCVLAAALAAWLQVGRRSPATPR